MPLLTDQAQMEAYVKSEMLEFLERDPDSIYTMMHPRLVRCDLATRTLEMVMHTTPWMRNTNGMVHGGVSAAVIDTVGGMACRCFAPTGALTPTVSLQVSYLDMIPIDAQLHVRAVVTRPGRSIAHVQVEAFGVEEKEHLYATGAAVYYIMKDAKR